MLLQVWHSCKTRGTPRCLWLLLKLSQHFLKAALHRARKDVQGFRCQGKPGSPSLWGHKQTLRAGPVYEPFTPAPLPFLETDRPPQQATPSSMLSLLNFISLAAPKITCFPSLGKHRKCVQHSVRVMQMGADEGHIQDRYTYTYRMKSLRVLSQWLSKDALLTESSPQLQHLSSHWLQPDIRCHRAAQGMCASLTSLWNFYFMVQSGYGTGKTGALGNIYWILFGNVYYLPVEWITLIMQVTAKCLFCNL